MKKNINIEKLIRVELVKINKNLKNIDNNTDFFEEGLDSLGFMKLIFNLENILKKKIYLKNYNKLNSILKMKKYIGPD